MVSERNATRLPKCIKKEERVRKKERDALSVRCEIESPSVRTAASLLEAPPTMAARDLGKKTGREMRTYPAALQRYLTIISSA
jgi:hypothetical protein